MDARPTRIFVIGTRGSRLALRQVEIVRDALLASRPGLSVDVRQIKTEGDASSQPLSVIGGTGVFTKAIEDRLLAGEVDIAIHSLKDLPPQSTPGLTIAAIPVRGDPRDALVTADGRSLAELPAGARIGTGSGRRAVLLRELRGDVEPVEIRGNVDTRIRKVEAGEYDGAVLAMAGLHRLGLESKAAQIFSAADMTPAVGQACLAVQVRADDVEAIETVRVIDDPDTHAAADAERAFLARLGAGCRLPVGGWATVEDGVLVLRGMLAAGEPPRVLRDEESGRVDAAIGIGERLADRLLGMGGQQ